MEQEVSKSFHCPFDTCTFYKKKSFKRKLLLDQHLLNCHSEKRFKCPNCNKQYAIDWQLKYHLKGCGRNWQCMTCNKIYKERLSLIMHCNRNAHQLPDNAKAKNLLNAINESQNNKFFIVPTYLNSNVLNGALLNGDQLNSDTLIIDGLNCLASNPLSSLNIAMTIKRNENKFRPILPKNQLDSTENAPLKDAVLHNVVENNLSSDLIGSNLVPNSSTTNNPTANFLAICGPTTNSQLLTFQNLSLNNNNVIDNFCQTDDLCQCPSNTQPLNSQQETGQGNNQMNKQNKSTNTLSVQCPEIRTDSTLKTEMKRKLLKPSTVQKLESHTQTYDSYFIEKPMVRNQSTCTEINSNTVQNLKRKSVASETTINNLNKNYCFFNDQLGHSNHLYHLDLDTYCNQQNQNSFQTNASSFTDSVINSSTINDSIITDSILNRSLMNSQITYQTVPHKDPLLSTISVQTDLDNGINDDLISELKSNEFNELDLGFNDIQTQTCWNFNDNTTQTKTEDFFDIDNFFGDRM